MTRSRPLLIASIAISFANRCCGVSPPLPKSRLQQPHPQVR